MRVLQVYRTYFPESQGGLEEVIRQICSAATQRGHQCSVFTLADEPIPHMLARREASVYREKRHLEIASCSISLGARRTFSALLQNVDLVHYHFPWPFADVLHLTSRKRKPALLTYHSDIVRQRLFGQLYRPLMHRFLSSMDSIVCTSPNYLATSPVLQRYAAKVHVVPIGLDEATYPHISDTQLEATRRTYGSDFFLFVGVLRYYKGLHILLDAMEKAPYRLVIAGAGPMERKLHAQARRLGLNNVTFTGFVSDQVKLALFRLCRAVVLPSYLRSEAFGVALLEGAMLARALISTEVGSGTSYVNAHMKTGLVVAPGSAGALRDAMDFLYLNPVQATVMGEEARRRYELLFTGQRMGERYLNIYTNLMTQQAMVERTG